MAVKTRGSITLVRVNDGEDGSVINLIKNGFCTSKDNTNFKQWTVDGANTYNNNPTFKYTNKGSPTVYLGEELIPINIDNEYEFSMFLKSPDTEKMYLGWGEYDIDGLRIEPTYCMGYSDTTTTLAKDLNNGDTVVYLTTTANWHSTTASHQLGFIFWNYKDSTGYQYPEGVYSRNAWTNLYTFANVNKTNNTIKLNNAWNKGTIKAGTKLSQSISSGWKYFNYSNATVPTSWTETRWTIKGTQNLYDYASSAFNQAAKYIKFIILHNYGNKSTSTTTLVNSVCLIDVTLRNAVNNAQDSADDANSKAENAETIASSAQLQVDAIKKTISSLVTDSSGGSMMTQTPDGWTFNIGAIQNQLNNALNGVNTANGEINAAKGEITSLQNAINSLNEIAGYLSIKVVDNQPCLELGKGDSEFKVRITNTDIKFMEGSNIPADIGNQALNIKKAVIKEELNQGGFSWVVRSNGNLGLQWNG